MKVSVGEFPLINAIEMCAVYFVGALGLQVLSPFTDEAAAAQ